MKSQMKALLLSLVGGVALMGAASAQAMPVTYKGHLTLRPTTEKPGTMLDCFAKLSGDYTIVPGGPNTVRIDTVSVSTDSSAGCAALTFPGRPWYGRDYRGTNNDDAVGALSIDSLKINVSGSPTCQGDLSGGLTPADSNSGSAPNGYPDHIILSQLPIPDSNPSKSNCVINGTITYVPQ